jgi:hypothetical protein
LFAPERMTLSIDRLQHYTGTAAETFQRYVLPWRSACGGQEMSLRDIAARLVTATGKKKGQHPSPATVMRMLREHDEKTAAASVVA